jgi:hypothetical protein
MNTPTVKLRFVVELPDEPAEIARYFDALLAMRKELPNGHLLLRLTYPLLRRLQRRLDGKG